MAVWQFKYVYGGVAEGESLDREATFRIGENINYRRTHDVMTLSQKVEHDSDLENTPAPVHWIRDTIYGHTFAYNSDGSISRRLTDREWITQHTLPASHGQGFAADPSYLYYAHDTHVGRVPIGSAGASWSVANDSWQPIAGSSWNPIKYFAAVDKLLIASDENLAVFDYGAGNFSATRLVMPRGWRIRDIEEWGDFVAISCWTGANIRASSQGKLILWDGLSERPNAFIDSEAGNIQMTMRDGYHLNVLAGVHGNIYRFESGQLNQKRKIPLINEDRGDWVDIYPGAKTTWRGIPHFGVAGTGATNASYIRGVYSWGTTRNNIPNSLNAEYIVPEAGSGAGARITALHTTGDNNLFVAWANASSHGLSRISQTVQQASGYVESLAFVGRRSEATYMKQVKQVRLLFKTLESVGGAAFVKIRADYSPSWATVGAWDAPSDGVFNAGRTANFAGGEQFPRGRVLHMRVELQSNFSGIAPELLEARVIYDVIPNS